MGFSRRLLQDRRGRRNRRRMDSTNNLRWIVVFAMLVVVVKAEMEPSVSSCSSNFYVPPVCINTPGPYICRCVPGFMWNGNFCMANAVNSKLVFPMNTTTINFTTNNYVKLVGKTFPSLERFTIAFWVKFSPEMFNFNTTLVSYKEQLSPINFSGGFSFQLTIGNESVTSPNLKITPGKWIHLAITWNNGDGSWATFLDGDVRDSGTGLFTGSSIDKGGEFIIGSPPREGATEGNFTDEDAMNFVGEIGHFHVWNEAYNERQIKEIFGDCSLSFCGNVVEWTDFRSGTRGHVKLLWPSNIFDKCGIDKVRSCDASCTKTLGPKCDEDVAGNLEWPRTTAGITVKLPCPTLRGDGTATRTCRNSTARKGLWGPVDISSCVTRDILVVKKEIQDELESPIMFDRNEMYLLENVTKTLRQMAQVSNPSDLVAVIDIIDKLIQVQNSAVVNNPWTERIRSHKDTVSYPTIIDTLNFSEGILQLVDTLLPRGAFYSAWNATNPRGYAAVKLLEVLDRLSAMLVRSLKGHLTRQEISLHSALTAFDLNKIAFFVRLSDPSELNNIVLPNYLRNFRIMQANVKDGALDETEGWIKLPEYQLLDDYESADDVIGYSFVKLTSLHGLLPNHPEPVVVRFYREKHLAFAHRENNVNTPVLKFSVFDSSGEKIDVDATSSKPLVFELGFIDPSNISNPTCQHLNTTQGAEDWYWSSEGCEVMSDEDDKETAMCACQHVGVFAVTTHMYDVNWDPGKPPSFYPMFPMYIGCIISIVFFAISLVTFFYFRCVTDTVAVHRNLAVSEILLQLIFLIGTPRTENEMICHVITLLIHFLFVSSFGWICNEAFNLYVEVANSIHSEHQQQRPMLRYYVIGWLAPAILVGVLAKTNSDEYFATNVCFMDLSFVWFMIGPAAGIWAITVFVLIYTGKDISESSYFKDEKTNKVITNHCKGCWIQIMLVVITWAFALFSVDMLSIIPQILFAMFDMLQGAFFFTFFCCLNGEVTEAINDYRMGMTQTSGLQRTTRYSIYRRYVPRPTTRRTLSNQSGGSSATSQTPRRGSLNSENVEDEESNLPLTNRNKSLREQVLKGSVDRVRLLRKDEHEPVEESTDEDPKTKEEDTEDNSIKEKVVPSDKAKKDLVTAV